eukprot:scaffold175389_cov21-Tisochrysis_lutea.AAC.1
MAEGQNDGNRGASGVDVNNMDEDEMDEEVRPLCVRAWGLLSKHACGKFHVKESACGLGGLEW